MADYMDCGSCSKQHFVDKHKEALINGVSLVDPILDCLFSAQLLSYETRETIRCEPTSYKQMRKLFYDNVKNWNDHQKDIFKDALKKHNRPLVENLEQSRP